MGHFSHLWLVACYNFLHTRVLYSQVIRIGNAGQLPLLMESTDMDVLYSVASSPNDPAATASINTTSENLRSVFKTNFRQQTAKIVELPGNTEKQMLGGRGYAWMEHGDFAPIGAPDGVIGVPDLLLLPRMVQAIP